MGRSRSYGAQTDRGKIDVNINKTRDSALAMLRRAMAGLPSGPVDEDSDDFGTVVSALRAAWPFLHGSNAQSTTADKIYRLEHLAWDAPTLCFQLERHGAMVVGGSGRAGLHAWSVDVENGTASCSTGGYRRLRSADSAFPTQETVRKLLVLLRDRGQHPWLNWIDEKTARLNMSKIVPTTNSQTTAGRRRRLIFHLATMAPGIGWGVVKRGSWVYLTRREVDCEIDYVAP
jgi:hypothetical protein